MRAGGALGCWALIAVAVGCSLDSEGDPREASVAAGSGGAASTSTSAAGAASSAVGGATDGGIAGNGGVGGRPSPSCASAPGPAMALLEHGAGRFCIDTTEVTSEHYAAFLDATVVAPPPMPAGCEDKLDHVPRTWENQCAWWHFDPVGLPDRPVACVDWCDAYAYCSWAGKRLCGRVGGGALTYGDALDAQGEWYFACSKGVGQAFPYGNGYDPTACKGDDWDGVQNGPEDEGLDVGALSTCEGGFPGVYDMSGNVMEWEDGCADATSNPSCHDRGGSFWQPGGEIGCEDLGPLHHTRRYVNKNIGFRCCANAVE